MLCAAVLVLLLGLLLQGTSAVAILLWLCSAKLARLKQPLLLSAGTCFSCQPCSYDCCSYDRMMHSIQIMPKQVFVTCCLSKEHPVAVFCGQSVKHNRGAVVC